MTAREALGAEITQFEAQPQLRDELSEKM